MDCLPDFRMSDDIQQDLHLPLLCAASHPPFALYIVFLRIVPLSRFLSLPSDNIFFKCGDGRPREELPCALVKPGKGTPALVEGALEVGRGGLDILRNGR
ncbi:hypothetical protein AcW1_009317 [Taiwanofungus camphoratus]|nr:hypothetical protein AcW1_009317 [Antrodia cinnamomea]